MQVQLQTHRSAPQQQDVGHKDERQPARLHFHTLSSPFRSMLLQFEVTKTDK
jgi:hypothetical protein